MVAAPINHISLDERGVAYIAGTTMKVAHIAIDAHTWQMTAQEIQDNYPRLSQAQIYAALAYYHDHKQAIDAQIASDAAEYERLRAEFPNALTREQFEARRQQEQPGKAAA